MRGLRKYLTPFAPDQSGAVSVLYEFGGIIAICDAGGCTGNICGFDEPRWFESKSALFSAGLRDMDAILGRDDKLVAKLADAVTIGCKVCSDHRDTSSSSDRNRLPCVKTYDREKSRSSDHDCGYRWNGIV